MSKDNHNGIVMEKTFIITDEKKRSFLLSARIIQFLAIVIGSWSFAGILIECLAVPADIFQLSAVILIITGIIYAACVFPSYDLVKLFFAVLFYSLFFISRFPRLRNAFYIFENLVLDRTTAYYNYSSIRFMADVTTQTGDTTLLLAMVLIPVIALLSIAVIRNRFIHLCCLVLFLPIAASLLVGLIPSERYLIAYVGIILYLARSGLPFRQVTNKEQLVLLHRINNRAAVWLSMIGLMIFFVLKLFITDESYNKVSDIKTMKEKVQSVVWDYSLEDFERWFSGITLFGGSSKATGGLNGGKLGKIGEVKYDNSEQLLLTVPVKSASEGLYLKGYVGSVYTGSSWEEHSTEGRKEYKRLMDRIPLGEFTPVNQNFLRMERELQSQDIIINQNMTTNQNVSISINGDYLYSNFDGNIYQGNCRVEYKEASKRYMYAPYFTNYGQLQQGYYVQDLYMAPRVKKDEYDFDYFFNVSKPAVSYLLINSQQVSREEKLYQDFVYKTYTELPEKGIEELKKRFASASMRNLDILEKLRYVENYLQQNTTYTLSPGKLPKGEDFVEYFLFQNKKGYCAHYASAAVLMLRAMGVPARYVEGYMVGPDSAGITGEGQKVTAFSNNGSESYNINMETAQISVRDFNAHAWTEVYIDDYGWLPMDFTPGSANQNYMVYNTLIINDLRKKETNQPNSNPTPPVNRQEPDRSQDDSKNTVKGASPKEQARLNDIFMTAFIILFVAASASFILYKFNRRRRLINTRNSNKKALFLIMEAEKILSVCRNGLPGKGARLEDEEEYVREHSPFIDSRVFEACMETARKARFGRGRISGKELEEMEVFRQNLYKEACKELSLFRKIYLRYILLMEI